MYICVRALVSILPLFLPCSELIFELSLPCGIFVFHFIIFNQSLFRYTGVLLDFNTRLCFCRWPISRQMSLVEQELLRNSSPFVMGLVLLHLSFCGSLCGFRLLFSFAIVLSVLHWFTASHYLIDIFKLFIYPLWFDPEQILKK